VQTAIDEAYAAGVAGKRSSQARNGSFKLDITVHLGAGAYICGPKNRHARKSIEGKRGWPRNKPPFSGRQGSFRPAHRDQQRGDPDERPRTFVRNGGDWFRQGGHGKVRRHPPAVRVRAR